MRRDRGFAADFRVRRIPADFRADRVDTALDEPLLANSRIACIAAAYPVLYACWRITLICSSNWVIAVLAIYRSLIRVCGSKHWPLKLVPLGALPCLQHYQIRRPLLIEEQVRERSSTDRLPSLPAFAKPQLAQLINEAPEDAAVRDGSLLRRRQAERASCVLTARCDACADGPRR